MRSALVQVERESGTSAPERAAPGAPSPLLSALRRATCAPHQQLEARLDVPGEARPYRRLLAAFAGYHGPCELALREAGGLDALGLDAASRLGWRSRALRDDLLALGMTAREIVELPRCRALPAVRSAHAALGCLYVIEGATLGGRVLLERVQASLGVAPDAGASFFAGYGAATDAMWAGFTAALAALPADEAVERVVVAAAVDTFATLERWLGERGALR